MSLDRILLAVERWQHCQVGAVTGWISHALEKADNAFYLTAQGATKIASEEADG